MATEIAGWNYPHLVKNDYSHGTVPWKSATNGGFDPASLTPDVLSSDDVDIFTVEPGLANDVHSNYLHCSHFGFSIPIGAAILGVKIRWECDEQQAGSIHDSSIKLLVAGSYGSSLAAHEVGQKTGGTALYNRLWTSSGSTADESEKRGEAEEDDTGDMMGYSVAQGATAAEALTPAKVNSSGFGCVIAAKGVADPGEDPAPRIDNVSMKVWYTTAVQALLDNGITKSTPLTFWDSSSTLSNSILTYHPRIGGGKLSEVIT